MNLEQVLNAIPMSRYQYLKERGFNGSNEASPEVLQATLGFVVDDSNGESYWISDALFKQLEELELAYAITIHKSQGSEYPAVLLPLLSGPKMLMNRNLLYAYADP